MIKRSLFVLVPVLAAALFLWQSFGRSVEVRNYVEKGVVDAEQIVREIEKPLSRMVAGIIDRNAEEIFSIFDDPQNATYVRDGEVYNSISTARRKYDRSFERQDHTLKRSFEFSRKEFDIVDPNTVLFTGVGVLSTEGSDSEQQEIAYTILWVFKSNRWTAIHMHISWN